MTSPCDNGNRWVVLGFTLGTLAVIAALGRVAPALALVNESPSLPEGLYLRTPGAAHRGAVVAIPQPDEARAYLGGQGMPANVLLIKRVAAIGGNTVCRRGSDLVTPGRTVRVLDRDRRGMGLPGWTGCRRLANDELFLLGDTPSSFDSRYFGPVRRAAVTGVYREGLTW